MELDWSAAALDSAAHSDAVLPKSPLMPSNISNSSDTLHEACVAGSLDAVKALVQCTGQCQDGRGAPSGAGAAARPSDGDSACFRAACAGGHADVVRYLLSLEGDLAVDPTARQSEAFREACARGHTGVVQVLLSAPGVRLDHHAEHFHEDFCAACRQGDLRTVRAYLQHRAQWPSQLAQWRKEALALAAEERHFDLMIQILEMQEASHSGILHQALVSACTSRPAEPPWQGHNACQRLT